MPEKRRATFYVEDDGTLYPRSKVQWMREGLQLFAGGQVVITYERPKRSLQANKYLWGVVYKTIRLAMLDAGKAVSSEALHQHFKRLYLDPDIHEMVDMETGEVTEYKTWTTTNLSTTQFTDFIERVKQDEVVLQLGCYIPEPGEQGVPELA
jgi:hypothetical protein